MKSFKDDNELFQFVEDYIVRDKLPSFQKDVDHCLSLPYAEFPAIVVKQKEILHVTQEHT
jgi:hypothetical protein